MKIAIEGMHCDACVRRVRKALESVEGVHVEDVAVGSATVAAASEQSNALLASIEKIGFQAKLA